MMMMRPQIILLKAGTDTSQGKPQIISNINACQVIVDAVKTTLGPRGMDKLIVDNSGKTIISNDGATIVGNLEVIHPAAKTLVDIAQSQDAEVGDGTTTVVLLAGEILRLVKPYVEEGMHTHFIANGIRASADRAVEAIRELQVTLKKENPQEFRSMLEKCASTSLCSKLVATEKEFFSKMVVDAVSTLDQELLPLKMIGIKKVTGGSLNDSLLIQGVAFKKTFSYAGFEMQPKRYAGPLIAELNVELELKAERENAELRLENVEEYQAVVDAEWNILYNKLGSIVNSGAKVVLSRLPIGDVATQYFADRDIFCAGRVTEEDMNRTIKGCGGSLQTTTRDIKREVLGSCELFEEVQIGGDRYNIFSGCSNSKTCTLILRGGAEQLIDETERSLHDAIMIVRRAIKHEAIVAGGGAVEMELSKILRDMSRTISGKQQFIVSAVAKSLEVIPRQLCDNAGFDANEILNRLRQQHSIGHKWIGVNIINEGITDNYIDCVWEPALVKINAITAACEAACLILSVDETIKAPKSVVDGPPAGMPGGPPVAKGRGRPM